MLALCVDLEIPGDDFFPEGIKRKRNRAEYQGILDICSECPVRRFCLVEAIKNKEYDHGGIWGGALPSQLKTIDKRTEGLKTRLRCPKCGKGQDLIDFVEQGEEFCCK